MSKTKRVIFILPLNELSGSCVSAVALANILIERGYTVDFICRLSRTICQRLGRRMI